MKSHPLRKRAMSVPIFRSSLWLLFMPAVAWAAEDVEEPLAAPVDGDPFRAELAGVDDQWTLSFRAGEPARALPAAGLVRWGACPEPEGTPLVVLTDGSLLAADVLGADKGSLDLYSPLFRRVQLPLERVAGVAFRLPPDQRARDLLLDRVAKAAGDADRVILLHGDEITGSLEAIRDDTAYLNTQHGPLDLEVHRLRAIMFNPALWRRSDRRGLHAVAGFVDGSRLVTDRLLVDDDSVQLSVGDGSTWSTTPEKLVFLQPLGGNVRYLSDVKPAGTRQLPYLDVKWPSYRPDRNVSGSWLRAGGRLHLKGLGVHSFSLLTYRLSEPYRRFQAEVAIDGHTAGQGSVRFRVFVDGEQRYVSPVIRGTDAPLPVSVDLSGAKRLDLIVDFAQRADVWDRADWLDARLVP